MGGVPIGTDGDSVGVPGYVPAWPGTGGESGRRGTEGSALGDSVGGELIGREGERAGSISVMTTTRGRRIRRDQHPLIC